MSWPHLFNRLSSRIVRRTGHERAPRPHWRFVRPCLEVLENRLAPATFTVSNLNDSGDGSLRQAILEADITPGANTIDFQAGLTGTIKLNSELFINSNMTIQGPAAGLTLDAQGKSRIFMVGEFGKDNDFGMVLSGLTLTGGHGFLGGAILNLANLSLTNCTLANNSAFAGGGIFNNFGTAALANCTLADNSADFAGGGIINAAGSMMLFNTIVADSTSGGDVLNEATLEGSNNLIEHGVGTTDLFFTINGDPQLGLLQDNGGPTQTIAIPTSSAAFQAGTGLFDLFVPFDQRGLPRPTTPSLVAFEPQLSPPPSPPTPPPAPPPTQSSPSLFQTVHTLFINGAQLLLDARGFGPLLKLPAQSDILASIHSNLPFAGIFGLPAVIAGANAANDALNGSST